MEAALFETMLFQIGISLFVSMLLGAIFAKYKQSAIVGYILGGVVLGPVAFGVVTGSELISAFSEFGILLLLFYIGLELDMERVRQGWLMAIILGPLKIAACFAAGFGAGTLLGFSTIESALAGLIISISSTGVIEKYLLDEGLHHSTEAKFITPALLIGDAVAITALAVLSSGETAVGTIMLNSITFVVVSLFIINQFSKYLMDFIERFDYRRSISMFALGIGLSLAFIANFFQLNPAIGAFLGGYLLSNMRFADTIRKEMDTFKDFFLAFFFVGIGLSIALPASSLGLERVATMTVIFLAAYLAAETVVVLLIGSLLGLELRSALTLSTTMLPLGEFSLLFGAFAAGLGTINGAALGAVAVFLCLITTMIMPASRSVVPRLTRIIHRLVPHALYKPFRPIAAVGSRLTDATMNDPETQETLLRGFEKLGVDVFALFAAVYLLTYAAIEFHSPIVAGVDNTTFFLAVGIILIIPGVFNVLREVRRLIGSLVDRTNRALFPEFNEYQLSEMRGFVSDVYTGLTVFLLAMISGSIALLGVGLAYLEVAVVLFAAGLFFLARGVYYTQNEYYTLEDSIRMRKRVTVGGRVGQ